MGETKAKPAASLRSPKPKKKLGLSVPAALRMPHDDLIKSEESATPVTPVTPVVDNTPVTPVTRVEEDVAPRRDFTRTANSIVRDAIPAGVFSGKGKQLYDYLYSKTRGAIVPVRSARIPTGSVMKRAGMTRHTYRAHLQKLISSGLVKVEEKPGEHGGNIFTVFLPEEAGLESGDRGDRGHTGVTVQFLDMVQGSETDPGDRGLIVDNIGTSSIPKTSLKTYDLSDDEAFADFVSKFKEAVKELTGREPAAAERAKYGELAEVIIAELMRAAVFTVNPINSVPAFLTAHFNRRFKARPSREAKNASAAEFGQGIAITESADTTAFKPEVMAAHLANARERLERTGEQLKENAAPELCDVLSRTAVRLSEIAAEVGATDYADVQGLEDSLTKLDEILDEAVRVSTPPAEFAATRAEAVAKLAPYGKRMETDAYEQALDGLAVKLQREKYGLPRLSMFYL